MKTRGLLLSVTDNRAKPLMNQLVVRVSSLSFSPHLCVGFLFLILYPGSASRLPPSHIIFHTKSLSHHFFTHTIFVNHHLSHTIFVNHLCQPTSFTHIFVNHICPPPSFTRHLSHTPSFTHHLCLTIFHTPSFPHHLCQPSSFTILSRTSLSHTYIHLRFAWQAWHLETSTLVLRGRRGAWRHPPWFCVALGPASLFSFLPFPSHVQLFFWLLIGRSWHMGLMGLSGPLTFHPLV